MISVCVATYNGEPYIQEQLESILSQLSEVDEIIVSDDGSTDRTIDIIKSLNDPRINIVKHKHNSNKNLHTSHFYVTKNFENAICHAKGDIIFLSDQDDRWLPGRVQTFLNALEEIDMAMCNFNLIDKNGVQTMQNYFPRTPVSHSIWRNLLKMPFFGSAMAFRKSMLKHILPFPQKLEIHDNWIGFISLKYGKFKFITQALHDYRRHDKNVSLATTNNSHNSLFTKIKYRLQFLFWYLQR